MGRAPVESVGRTQERDYGHTKAGSPKRAQSRTRFMDVTSLELRDCTFIPKVFFFRDDLFKEFRRHAEIRTAHIMLRGAQSRNLAPLNGLRLQNEFIRHSVLYSMRRTLRFKNTTRFCQLCSITRLGSSRSSENTLSYGHFCGKGHRV
jgi:hypothetical protein